MCKKYFDKTEWNEMPNILQCRYCNMYETYIFMTQSGMKFPNPDFMDQNKRSYNYVNYNNKSNEAMKSISLEFTKLNVTNDQMNINNKSLIERVEVLKLNFDKNEEINTNNKCINTIKLSESKFINKNKRNKSDEKETMSGEPSIKKRKTIDKNQKTVLPAYGEYIKNEYVPKNINNLERAERTVPMNLLVVKKSKISGLGVWNLKHIPKGKIFGPYEGEIKDESNDYGYSWEIKGRQFECKYIDAINPGLSNWLRYVNCARNKYEQNLISFQYSGQIYYKTITDIEPYNELLVWYGTQFATELGIDLNKYHEPLKDLKDIFCCNYCKINFSNPIQLEEHERNCYNEKKTLIIFNELNINEKNIEEKSYKEEH